MKLSGCGKNHPVSLIAVSFAWILIALSWGAQLAAAQTVSRFADQIDDKTYPKADPPENPPVFQWDFSRAGVVHAYFYQQRVINRIDMNSLPGSPPEDQDRNLEQEMAAEGLLQIKSQGSHFADFVLSDLKMTMTFDTGKEGESQPKTMEQTAPPMVVSEVGEDGSGPFGSSSLDMVFKLLFPLPSKSLEVGESVDMPTGLSFNAMGSLLPVKGRSRITLTRYVMIGDAKCARLDTDIDISRLRVPPDVKGEFNCSAKGASVFYFDIAKRAFVSGALALVMEFTVDAPTPEVRVDNEEEKEMPRRMEAFFFADNLIRVEPKP